MVTIDISVPDPMRDWVVEQARSGRYSDASDYVRELIRRDQELAETLADMQRQIDEGFDSGVSERSMAEVLDLARAKGRAKSGA